MNDQPFLFLDFEFTMPENKRKPEGFFPEIIEVGMVAVHGGEVTDTFSSYVKPEKFPVLTERCKAFLNMKQEEIESGIGFAELVERLSAHGHAAVITWGNMDVKVLRQNCQAAGAAYPFRGKHRDLSLEYKRFFGDRNQTGLWKAIEAYGKKGTGKHHCALDDAWTTYNIFKLVEKDKEYLLKPAPTKIGDLVDFSKLMKKVSMH
ncbi:3'-5' exonuclease KapD [Ectobacillus ponti]|uniref:3'-5' exonuclease KapD n=1 Tax=Ectobacillus ponti TaxID=2961894 RepID=A0AA42BTT2_9BACI|nr:3'-5' exonuclease KapD [Ectobacillus ponti]MCP8969808.1 3'-5' exonuclease KapD [Ectobacillus ponti]